MVTKRRFISTSKDALKKQENFDFSKGYNSYLANDVVPDNQLVLATDTRIPTLGRQKTRRGCDFYSVPAGETVDAQQTSTTGAADQSVGLTTWQAKKWTAGATGRLTRVEIRVKNASSATGPIILHIYSDSSGSPGTLLAQTSIPASTPTNSYGYLAARLIEAPQVTNTSSYWTVAYVQDDGSGSYQWSSTTNATTAKSSTNSGVTWSSTSYDLNHKAYISTDSPTLGYFRAYKSDGTKKSLLAHGTSLYGIDDVTGALTAIKTGLGSASRYEFEVANDTVYYANGVDAPRKWDFTTEAASGGSPAVASQVTAHKSRLFYVSTSDPTKIYFSNIAAFETFTSTDFLYVPSPKSPDPITRLAVLNDNLYIFTKRTKWVLFGSDISNMVLRKAPGTKGTVAPDSVVVTRNHIYFASDDGFYRFNGSTDELLSEAITSEYAAVTNRDDMGGAIWNNRYYLFYTPSGAQNSRCWVYNINYNSMESSDTGAYVQKTGVWTTEDNQFIQASNLVGAVYYAEAASNQYTTLGKKLSWEIRTKYQHFGNPASQKQIKRWYPRFATGAGTYAVQALYDRDFADSPTALTVSLSGGSSFLWDVTTDAFWDTTTELWDEGSFINPRLTIPGVGYYIQLRYKREAVNNPVEFLGHTQYFNIRRPR